MTTSDALHGGTDPRTARTAGIVLIAASLLSILLMAHHPTAGTHDSASLAAAIAAKADLSRFVHGGLIALIGVELFALGVFCSAIGSDRSAVRAGFVAYAIGAAAMIGAALISGFVVSDLADHYANAADADAFAALAQIAWAGNQALAKLGVVAMSLATALWAIALLQARRALWVAIIGLIAGAVPVAALALGLIRLDVTGMLLIVLAWTAWNLAAGVYLVRLKS